MQKAHLLSQGVMRARSNEQKKVRAKTNKKAEVVNKK